MDSYDDGRNWSPEQLLAAKERTDRLWAQYQRHQALQDHSGCEWCKNARVP